MKHQTKLSQEQLQVAAHQTGQQAAHEFANAEELLRHDAKQTAVPPQISQRLKRTTGKAAAEQPRSWWKNLFGQ